jgi:KaiC/GvpD/RAD55 family RecA-like ATPase
MNAAEQIRQFYLQHLPGAQPEGTRLTAACPFCASSGKGGAGKLVVDLDPDSFFYGYFRCLNRCCHGGFPLHFGRLLRIDPRLVPGYDPDRSPYARGVTLPFKNMNAEVRDYQALMTKTQYDMLAAIGIGKEAADEMRIGFNGRYLIFPYFLDDGNCYAAHCVLPGSDADSFWTGDERFQGTAFQLFNEEDIQHCENGALFITDGEKNLLALRELGYPGIAVPSLSVLETLDAQRFAYHNHVLILLNNSPEAELAARALAMRLGFKVRILKWPPNLKREYHLIHLAKEAGAKFGETVAGMVRGSKAFSPFASPEREHVEFTNALDANVGKGILGVTTGFATLDRALSGIRGINILGGQPKAGKSCFFMQVSTEAARAGVPVIYYDFENGRHKIYLRTLCRISRLAEEELRQPDLAAEARERLGRAREELGRMLQLFRVVTDRRLSPDIMRRQIDFIKHETRLDTCMVVIDSLHKLPFKNLSERRTGIDEWLRHMEAIRDEQNVAFLVVSELSRGSEGSYSRRPDLGAFKESGDIEYSADNAIILQPNWDLLDPLSTKERRSTLWLVASRENSPGRVAEYVLDYPYWGFKEEQV